MKKVRLFAVAAAMGMFAATVNAAQPTVTKEAYKATWGTMDEIVRAEIGGKIVLPTANVEVTKEVRTTDKSKAQGTQGSFGTVTYTGYVGLTDTVAKDVDNNGLADYDLLTLHADNADEWFFDDLKFWPTVKTSLYYIGMTGNGLGARFIAPNAEAEKGWIIANTHTKYATEDAVLKALEDAGLIKQVFDKDGDLVEVIYNQKTLKNTAKKKVATVWTSLKADTEARYGIKEFKEDVVSLFDGTLLLEDFDEERVDYKVSMNIIEDETPVPYLTADGDELEAGDVYVVYENRYGELVATADYEEEDIEDFINDDKIVVVLKDGNKFTKYVSITPKTQDIGEDAYSLKWNPETGIFEKKAGAAVSYDELDDDAADLLEEVIEGYSFEMEGIKTAGGLYKYNNPKNTTDKIVINFDLGVYGYELDIAGINTTKSTMDIVDAADKEFTTGAVKLDGKWYPTVNNIDELGEFVKRVAGLKTPTDDVYEELYERLVEAKRYSTITWLDGTQDKEYIPETQHAHYKAQQITYIASSEKVDAANVVVTNNASEIDTNQYGVHTVKLTAKVGETVVGTKDVKVVIAPKYVREYKNGKVTSLKAYHLNGNLYSHTTFDYTAKKATAVFYAQDGVTAVETQTSEIK